MADEITQVKDILQALGDAATPGEVYTAVRDYRIRDIQAAMFSIVDPSGGGGTTPGIYGVLVAGNDADGESLLDLFELTFENNSDVQTLRLVANDQGTPRVFVGSLGGARIEIQNSILLATAGDGTTVRVQVKNDGEVEVSPDDGYTAFIVTSPHANANAALDCGGLPIVGLPTVNPGVAGALWNNAGTPAISAGP